MSESVYNENLHRRVPKGSFMDQQYNLFVKYCFVCDRSVDEDDMPCMISLMPMARTSDINRRATHCLDCRASEGYADSDITDPPF